MCRNIKTLANFEPPATDDEVRASALQFVHKISGTNKPSKANEELSTAPSPLNTHLAASDERMTTAAPRNRDA